jgi:glycosyltransferase involved in cell wall biosynthesis
MGGDFSRDIAERLYKVSMRRTARVIAVSQASADVLLENHVVEPDRLSVINNGIPAGRFTIDREDLRRTARNRLGADPKSVVFGAVGRLVSVKNHAGLVTAFASVARQDRSSKLVVIGDGPLRQPLLDQCERLGVADRVLFMGSRSDVRELLPGFDVFVQPSFTESYSIAIVEAAAAGLPVIATSVGGNAEIVTDGLSGIIVPPDNVPAIESAMMEMLKSSEQRQKHGAAAAAWFDRRGRIEACAGEYECLYREVIDA